MRRFEFSDGKSNKFWEIALDGNTFTVRYGRMGTDGQTNTKVFDSADKAQKEADKAIRSKTKKGYVEVEAGEPAQDGAGDLESAIHADPDDLAAWKVFADWLQGEGDPRGDLVAVHIALAEKPTDAGLKARASELMQTQHKALFGEIDPDELGECWSCDWHMGFWKRVKIGVDWDHDIELVKLLGQVLRHPSARFLQTLELGLADNEGENYYDDLIKSLVKHGKRPGLRRLHVGAFEYPDETEISWTEVGDVSKAYAVLPDLEDLQVTGGGIELGKLVAPGLRKLFLETGGLPAAAARSVAQADLGALEELEVWFGTEDYGGSCGAAEAAAILANPTLKKLRRLGLKNADFQDDICREVVAAPLIAQLEELDLSMGTMQDSGAQVLLDHAGKLKHLKKLDLSDNFISDAMVAQLAAALPNAALGDQEAPDTYGDEIWTYVSVGE